MLHLVAKLFKTHGDFKSLMEGLSGHLANIKEGKPGQPGLPAPRVDEEALVNRLFKRIMSELSSKLPNEEKIFQRVAKRVPKVKDGTPGRDAVINYDVIVEELKKRKIKPEHIDGLEQTMSTHFEQMRSRLGYVHGGGDSVDAGNGITITATAAGRKTISTTAASSFAENETPSGTINGSNTAFTLAHAPTTGSLKLFLNGARQQLTGDYTLSGTTITFLTAPQSGSILLADYRY
jgi:hypothetical protein